MKTRVLDLFCGGGGSGWGAQAAGTEIVSSVDAWDIAAATYQSNFPDAYVVNTRLDEKSSVKLLGDIGPIDMILASPECTNHTCAKGSQPRDEDSKKTANYVIRFADRLKPRWVVIENVIQMRNWEGYQPLLGKLAALGYNVRPQIIDSADFGVPQARRRLFLLCDREVEPNLVVPSRGQRIRTAREIVELEGSWPSRPLYSEGRAPGTIARAEKAMAELPKYEPFLIVYYGSDGSGGWQSLDRPLRTMTTLDRFGLVTWEKRTPMLRMLQVPELMRAMGFDRKYTLPHGTRRDKIKLLGNGVCPPVMKAIVTSITRECRLLQAAE
jgi:DNA (cytosine-5)-methyltransferase 1